MREKMMAIRGKVERGEKLTDEEQKMADDMRKRMGGGQPGGPDMERLRGIFERKQRGDKLTDEEEKLLDEAQKRRAARESEAQPGGGEFTWAKARAAHEKEERGDTLNDDEKKLLAEARKRFEEGRGPDSENAKPPGAPQQPPGVRPQANDDFDWQKARAAHEKEERGEKLTDDETKLLEAAKKRISEGRGPK